MIVMLLTEHHLGFLSSKGGCTGSSESILVKTQHCWKTQSAAHILCLVCACTYIKYKSQHIRFWYLSQYALKLPLKHAWCRFQWGYRPTFGHSLYIKLNFDHASSEDCGESVY